MISGYRGLAKTFIQTFKKANHQLSILVRREEVLADLKKEYPEAYLHLGDVSSSKVCENWVEKTFDHFGTVDLLINNAAITGPAGKLHEIAFKDFQKAIETNLLAPVNLTHWVLRRWEAAKKKSGVVINLSGGGATYARPNFSSYAVSKCAMVRMTETLAEEYPDLRFYAISPGALQTPMVEAVLKMDPAKVGREYEEAKRRFEQGGEDPQKAANLAQWLFENRPETLSGKLISAIWDDYQQAPDYPKQVGWWTLRRVDEVCLKHLKDL